MKVLGGYTGFVGSNLLSFDEFDVKVNSSNAHELQGADVELLVWSGVKAEKWKANQDPAADRAHVEEVARLLRSMNAKRAVLISTVDVYPNVTTGDERTSIHEANHAYGSNRKWLEEEFQNHFSSSHVVRLPALFGKGLKKNFVFDLLNGKDVSKVHEGSSFQFYCLDWLVSDLNKVVENNISLINLSVEPTTAREVAKEAFNLDFNHKNEAASIRYDIKTIHSKLWGRSDGYLRDRSEVLQTLKTFIRTYEVRR